MQPPFFYDLDDDEQKLMLEVALGNRGVVVSRLNGMCGDIFIFDQGERVVPRYVCAKVPRKHRTASIEEVNKRFVEELALQLRFSQHSLVHWCFDLREVLGAPVAMFRYWDGDLRSYMSGSSDITKLSLIAYCCTGLIHCYARGLVAHQDLKPANIFVRDLRKDMCELPALDVYQITLIADFGLANACIKVPAVFDGSRPYMAPEQWNKSPLSEKTDVFALGIILHELMTNGFHPAGVRSEEVWPLAAPGHSTKWTRPESWKKWISGNCPLKAPVELSEDVKRLIESTLSIDPASRPGMEKLRDLILELIKSRCEQAHFQLETLIKYYDLNASKGSLEEEWPYLATVWKRFQNRFG
ncbi:protein kinase [Pseudomonas asiatica]|uniref:serine/threonine protein kinase n=1 Tax=Pseudomonas asiatica TaxID=2219225 RepID=UPI0025704C1D|nr:protein kinase [Pseudomonas asiatica]WJD67836.1 protein kinase [Pseudomonas asiatica]